MPTAPLVLAAAAAAALGLGAPVRVDAQPAVRIIVHPANPVTALTRDQVSRLFLKKVTRWEAGLPAVPVDLPSRSPLRSAFTREVHRRSLDAVKLYWRQQIYSAREVPPPDRASEAEVVGFVRTHPGAIGYVSVGAELRGVRVVPIVER